MDMDGRVLLLNATYEPICVVPLKRAVILVLSEKAEIIAAHDTVVRSASFELSRPAVVRLVRYVNIPRFRKAYLSRRTIVARDNQICCYCGSNANTMDHIQPRSRGGKHSWTNVVACCFDCNQTKDDRTPEEMGWKMRYRPTEPEGSRRILLIVGSMDPEWEEWMVMT
ncbi:MAG: HNH endonuclease [Anaerolineae bacterium]|nr:HNH endonuclease [Anaerolineae bacterium]